VHGPTTGQWWTGGGGGGEELTSFTRMDGWVSLCWMMGVARMVGEKGRGRSLQSLCWMIPDSPIGTGFIEDNEITAYI